MGYTKLETTFQYYKGACSPEYGLGKRLKLMTFLREAGSTLEFMTADITNVFENAGIDDLPSALAGYVMVRNYGYEGTIVAQAIIDYPLVKIFHPLWGVVRIRDRFRSRLRKYRNVYRTLGDMAFHDLQKKSQKQWDVPENFSDLVREYVARMNQLKPSVR